MPVIWSLYLPVHMTVVTPHPSTGGVRTITPKRSMTRQESEKENIVMCECEVV